MMQIQKGRARAYALLADLISKGVRPSNLEAARTSPRLAEAMDGYPSGDSDALAVDHQGVLGFSVALFEGAYLDETSSWGGRFAASCGDAYRAMGWMGDPRGEEPEHLSTQLRGLAFLSGAEADALADGRREMVERVQSLSRDFLDGHLLRWLPVFTSAVRRSQRPFPVALAEQAQELVLHHRSELGSMSPGVAFALPPPELSLEDPGTGLGEIAAYLATPGRAGMYLSRDDLAALGRSSDIPRGFGDRVVTLQNLLQSASHLGALDSVLGALSDRSHEWRSELEAERWSKTPSVAALLQPWRDRAANTAQLLERIREAHALGEGV